MKKLMSMIMMVVVTMAMISLSSCSSIGSSNKTKDQTELQDSIPEDSIVALAFVHEGNQAIPCVLFKNGDVSVLPKGYNYENIPYSRETELKFASALSLEKMVKLKKQIANY